MRGESFDNQIGMYAVMQSAAEQRHDPRIFPAPKAAAGVAVHKNITATTGSIKLHLNEGAMIDGRPNVA